MKLSPSFSGSFGAGNRIYQYLAMLTGTLSIICSGMHYGWPSPSLRHLQHHTSDIPVTNSEGSWMAVSPLIGAIGGSLLGGAILNRVGRKLVILGISFPFFTAWIMVAYGQSAIILIVARCIAGFADGLTFCAVPMYLGEIADPNIRGFLGSSCSVTWILGILLINILGSYLNITTTALISSILPVLSLATFIWMPESPYYLIMKGKYERAVSNLKIFRGEKNVDAEFARLCKAVRADTAVAGRLVDLFTIKSNRRAVLIMMGLRGGQQLSGAVAVVFYAQTIFEETGSKILPSTASIILFSVQLIVCMLSSIIVDRTGRRPLLIISIIGSGFCLLIEGVYFFFHKTTEVDVTHLSFIPVAALIMFIIVFSIGMQTIPILVLGELFSNGIKAYALSFADMYFCVIATLVSKFFQIVKDEFGMHVPFFAFAVSCICSLFFIVYFVPETKGKTLEEIQDCLKGKSKVRLEVSTVEWNEEEQCKLNGKFDGLEVNRGEIVV